MRIRLATALALLVLAISGGNALAGGPLPLPPDTDTGNAGVHVLIDNDDYPGARCIYNSGPQLLTAIRVRAPIVYAYDRTGSLDRQTVGWRYRIWTTPDPNGQDWAILATGPIQKRAASDRNNAAFKAQTYIVPPGHMNDNFFVQVLVRWFPPNASTSGGRAAMGVRAYYNDTPYSDYVTRPDCYGFFT